MHCIMSEKAKASPEAKPQSNNLASSAAGSRNAEFGMRRNADRV